MRAGYLSHSSGYIASFNIFYTEFVTPGCGGSPPDGYFEIVHMGSELWRWMQDNISHLWTFSEETGEVRFWDSQDAILFKLRWL